MRIGMDFDNTIICYDNVFSQLAKSAQLIKPDWHGTKQQLRDIIQALPEGDVLWQKLQGKAYGEYIYQATLFEGVKDFIISCNSRPNVDVFIVSHKTEFGHFDEKRISLHDAAREWLRQNAFFNHDHLFYIKESHVYFATTREEKIERIKSLGCTHFIDDLPEVLDHPMFPNQVKRFLFHPTLSIFSSWKKIQHAIFSN